MTLQQDMEQQTQPRYPEGRQISYFALEAMGLTAGDIGELMRQMRKNSGDMAGGMEKAARTEETQGIEAQDAQFQKEREDEQKRETDERQREQQRQQEAHLAQTKQDQMTWEQKQAADKAAIEKHAQDEKANQSIIKGTIGMMLLPLGLGLGANVIGLTGQAMSGAVSGLDGTTMVASNNEGGMLGMLRGFLGMDGPAQKDMLLTGPNAAVPFIPGQSLTQPAPDMAAPGPNQQMQQLPGMMQLPTMAPKQG